MFIGYSLSDEWYKNCASDHVLEYAHELDNRCDEYTSNDQRRLRG